MDISEFKTLKEIHEHFAVSNRCDLKKTATQPVYEINPPSSGLVFIGEAPGANEDKEGKPFVGSAGQLLDSLLGDISIKRSEVYVTNVVKYRPPSNRDPIPKEKDACRKWLNAELLFVKPRIIVALGKHALERFVPSLKISSAHGQAYEHPSGIPVFAMYHPAVALYNPSLKDTLKGDFQKLKDFLDGKAEVIGVERNEKEDSFDKGKRSLVNDILSL